ncbi:hypothetical protein FFF34_003120 [Inquilinus sp. KBS0705]|nr:hypothetical protein FFF34_003120 [Inquilinus sp. KBS0705]
MLEIGCDGGSIKVSSKSMNGIFIYQLSSYEIFDCSKAKYLTFVSLDDTWSFLKNRYKGWYQLYLIQICTQMAELVKKDYILADDKNEYTINSWLEQLTGRGLRF